MLLKFQREKNVVSNETIIGSKKTIWVWKRTREKLWGIEILYISFKENYTFVKHAIEYLPI